MRFHKQNLTCDFPSASFFSSISYYSLHTQSVASSTFIYYFH